MTWFSITDFVFMNQAYISFFRKVSSRMLYEFVRTDKLKYSKRFNNNQGAIIIDSLINSLHLFTSSQNFQNIQEKHFSIIYHYLLSIRPVYKNKGLNEKVMRNIRDINHQKCNELFGWHDVIQRQLSNERFPQNII